tara:strand:+ start:118 stop:282 length:165 start_codon:yes stop_codon:yes gene_type:complete
LKKTEYKKAKKNGSQKNDRFLSQTTPLGPPSLGEPITEIFERSKNNDENKITKI